MLKRRAGTNGSLMSGMDDLGLAIEPPVRFVGELRSGRCGGNMGKEACPPLW